MGEDEVDDQCCDVQGLSHCGLRGRLSMPIVQIELLMDVVMRESKITQISDPSESDVLAKKDF